MLEAVKVALDPTPRQERALLSHAGAARFAYNAALAHVKSQIEAGKRPDWSYYSLRRLLPAQVVERRQGRACPLVAREQQRGLQRRPGITRPRPQELLRVQGGRAQGAARGLPKVQDQGRGCALLLVHHRLLRPDRRRLQGAQAPARRARPLLRGRRAARWRREGHAHDDLPEGGTVVRLAFGREAGWRPGPRSGQTVGRRRPRRQEARHVVRRHGRAEPARVQSPPQRAQASPAGALAQAQGIGEARARASRWRGRTRA